MVTACKFVQPRAEKKLPDFRIFAQPYLAGHYS
jgi:hypothetical protein